jgi:hypothetical protein
MSSMQRARKLDKPRKRGVALVTVLYFLVLAAFTSIAVVFGTRMASRRGLQTRTDAVLIGAGDALLHGALAHWDGASRVRQRVGTTAVRHQSLAGDVDATLSVTRLATRVFSLVADVRSLPRGPARRLALLVRVAIPDPAHPAALASAVDVSVGDGVRITTDSTCADTASSAVSVAPDVTVSIDPAVAPDQRPTVRVDSAAADSMTYLRIDDMSWHDQAAAADVHLAADSHVAPRPLVAGSTCIDDASNWGDPVDSTSPCSTRTPVVFVPGDLTIDGGRGQGVLLVDGRLVIAGAFTFSGQIVVRRGIETRADAISISGGVYAWRATSDSTQSRATRADVVLTHETELRLSRCDAAHGMESWIRPRPMRLHAWSELF